MEDGDSLYARIAELEKQLEAEKSDAARLVVEHQRVQNSLAELGSLVNRLLQG